MVKNVTKDYFNKNVYDLNKVDENGELKFLGKKPVLIDFYATWCGPFRVLEPILDELYEEYGGKIEIYKSTSKQGIQQQKKMDNSEEFLRKTLADKLKIHQKEVEGFE